VLFARQTRVAHIVAHTPGSIGYTDLAAARAAGFQKRSTSSTPPGVYAYSDANHMRGFRAWGRSYTFRDNLFWIPLETASPVGAFGSGRYAEPTLDPISIRTSRKGANCRYATYDSVPSAVTGRANPYGDWSQTNAILDPGRYPLCTLTYIGFWDDPYDVYGGSIFEQARARTVKDYLTTTFYSGQNILFRNDYAPVPVAPAQDLRWAARYAAAQSGWKKP
jgi:ABC-type phosphate transport system substrate-binding protein